MKLILRRVGLALSLSVCRVDARIGEAAAAAGNENAVDKRADISPTLVPESDAKFFGKDYPFDKRPAADVLHFKFPYPVVQDSGDYDADYIKDENHDSGEYHAQTEYDRLRHKLAKEKEDVGKALRAREQAEKELEEAMKRDREMKAKKQIADETKREAAERKKKLGHAKGGASSDNVEPAESGPGGISSDGNGDVQVATADTEKAMTKLEECRKELQETRDKLKKTMEELEEARKKEKGAEADLDAADEAARKAAAAHGDAEKYAEKEYEEYMEAKEKYMKQQSLVAKMAADIEKAAAKVRGFRASEDADGGVYPTPGEKSFAHKSGVLAHIMVSIVFSSVASFLF